MRVSVFGLGHVGCVTGACLARAGHDVVGLDLDPHKVAQVNGGQSTVVEPGLGELVAQVVRAGRLRASASADEAVDSSDVVLLCVGPPGRADGSLDVSELQAVSGTLGRALADHKKPAVVVVRSTVLPGTTRSVVAPALSGGGARGIRVAVNPEFMRRGSSLADYLRPPFTLLGCEDPGVASLVRCLYSEVEAPFVHTSLRTAETVKYVANAFHALKVCFANEIADVCSAVDADAHEVMRVFALDRKLSVSDAYLKPGFAFGGPRLPKDVRALLHRAGAAGVVPPLLSAMLPSNEAQLRRRIEAVLATGKRKVGVVGLAFKPGTDDLRESPLFALVEALIGEGCAVRILDRDVSISRLVGGNRRHIQERIPDIARLMCEDAVELLDHAEVLVVGNAGRDAERVLALASPRHRVVDLTRGLLPDAARPWAAA